MTHSPTANGSALLAPRWHTALLVALIVAVAVTGGLLGERAVSAAAPASAGSRIFAVYLPLLLVQCCLTVYVCHVGRSQNALVLLLGAKWDHAHRAAADIAVAFVLFVLIEAVAFVSARWFGAGSNASLSALLPDTGAERVVWVVVSIAVGFCEEVIYRGYLQTQFAAFTRSTGIAIVAQAALFGLAHGEQGASNMARVAVYGLVFGVVARARQSLLPGILGHIAIDLASGFVGR